jgi:mono/diheme cytochrome c family protein
MIVAVAIAGSIAAAEIVHAATKPGNDVSISMKLGEIATAGPVAKIKVSNRGTLPQTGVAVRVYANEDHGGTELWNGTVDVPPGKSVRLVQQVWVDGPVEALCATATLAGAGVDERPGDNTARAGLVERGRVGIAFAGREAWSAHCASCHGTLADGGAGPALVGTRSKELRLKAATGGDHDFPWFGAADGRTFQTFLRSPATLPDPDYPVPPPGGWPGYAANVKPILDGRCVNCHGGGLAEHGVRLHTYEAASQWARRALFSIRSGQMPPGGRNVPADEVQVLADWIEGGRRP